MSDLPTYKAWKASIPFLYDWFANHHLDWPSLCCRWGPQVSQSSYKSTHRLFSSERTDKSDHQLLIISTAVVAKPRTAAAEQILSFKEVDKSKHIKQQKAIAHPGEIRDLGTPEHRNLVVTHTDANELYVWNVDTQPPAGKAVKGAKLQPNVADLTLTGHEDKAQYALCTSAAAPMVGSGGTDNNVLVWDLRAHDGGSLLEVSKSKSTSLAAPSQSPQLPATSVLQGHTQTVEDVVFAPNSADELASVGDDQAVLLWDRRSGNAPASRLIAAHGDKDLHTVDWSRQEPFQIATGAADGSLKVWDRRKLQASSALLTLALHKQAIMRVEFMPSAPGVLASGGDDGSIAVWNLAAQTGTGSVLNTVVNQERDKGLQMPPQLLFQHLGHRAQVVDFQWHPEDPYTMMSVSEEEAGGTLQLWRICELVTKPEKEVLAELDKHKQYVIHGRDNPEAPSRERSTRGQTPSMGAVTEQGPAAGASQGEGDQPNGVKDEMKDE